MCENSHEATLLDQLLHPSFIKSNRSKPSKCRRKFHPEHRRKRTLQRKIKQSVEKTILHNIRSTTKVCEIPRATSEEKSRQQVSVRKKKKMLRQKAQPSGNPLSKSIIRFAKAWADSTNRPALEQKSSVDRTLMTSWNVHPFGWSRVDIATVTSQRWRQSRVITSHIW